MWSSLQFNLHRQRLQHLLAFCLVIHLRLGNLILVLLAGWSLSDSFDGCRQLSDYLRKTLSSPARRPRNSICLSLIQPCFHLAFFNFKHLLGVLHTLLLDCFESFAIEVFWRLTAFCYRHRPLIRWHVRHNLLKDHDAPFGDFRPLGNLMLVARFLLLEYDRCECADLLRIGRNGRGHHGAFHYLREQPQLGVLLQYECFPELLFVKQKSLALPGGVDRLAHVVGIESRQRQSVVLLLRAANLETVLSRFRDFQAPRSGAFWQCRAAVFLWTL